MLPVGPLVIVMREGGADCTNQKAAKTATRLMKKMVLKAAARPNPKVSVKRVRTRRAPIFSVINANQSYPQQVSKQLPCRSGVPVALDSWLFPPPPSRAIGS